MSAVEEEAYSAEIVNRGVEDSGPYAGSLNFSVRVRRALPDFLGSVNLKYVRLGYHYLISHGFYFIAAPAALCAIFFAELGKQITWQYYSLQSSIADFLYLALLLGLLLYAYLGLTPPSTYLIDYACFRPPDEFKTSKEEFIELARKSGRFSDHALNFQQGALKRSGIGDETYLPRSIFQPGHKITLKDGREEAGMVMFGAVNELLATTKVRPRDIDILIVNCGVLNTTPSLSAMVINHFKLRQDVHSFNIGGMGCAAGVIAIDLAKDLLNVYPGRYALVVSTEVITYTWYGGDNLDMLLPNCFFRMGAAAILLSSRRLDRWCAKYELKQLVRTHKGMDDSSYKSIRLKEDSQGTQGLSVNKDVIEIGGDALKANITTLGPLVLPVSEQIHFFNNFLFSKNNTSKPYIPNYKLAFEHVCILATSKKVLEANSKVRKGDRIWQISFGSGFKCNSVVWKALRNIRPPSHSPWIENVRTQTSQWSQNLNRLVQDF